MCDCDDEYETEQKYFEHERLLAFKEKLTQTLKNTIENSWDSNNYCLFCSVFVEDKHQKGCIVSSLQDRLEELKHL